MAEARNYRGHRMEWLHEDITRGQAVLTAILLLLTGSILFIGRKKLSAAVPVALVVLFIGAAKIPSAISARPTTQRNTCIANLHEINGAKDEWLLKHGANGADLMKADLLAPNGILRHFPSCPRGGTYNVGRIGENPSCTLSNKGHRLDALP
jgi:hypothetical protein